MDVRQIEHEPSNKLIKDYLRKESGILEFFDYPCRGTEEFRLRAEELASRTYQRTELVNALVSFNKQYTDSEHVFKNIEKLKDQDTVAVVGGQQAGLMTGPAFSIHKCVSVIKMAREQEKLLGVPVVPVFWIAGEDHDLDEVNHVFAEKNGLLRKKVLENIPANKKSVSFLKLDQDATSKWIKDVLHSYGETEHTEAILEIMEEKLKLSSSYVDFFAHLIHFLFEKEGLIVMDSADLRIRDLEKQGFSQMIQRNEAINQSVVHQLRGLEAEGYSVQLDQQESSSNIFYDDGEGRVLLERENGLFVHPGTKETFTEEQLIEKADALNLSNNVVTRPIMQDIVLPVLSFIAGPGEISYWASLRGAFHELGIKMPVVVPRLHFTIFDRQTVKWLSEKSIGIDRLFQEGISTVKDNWLKNVHPYPVDKVIGDYKNQIKENHKPLDQLITEVDAGHEAFSEKNLTILLDHVERFESKINQLIARKYEVELKRFEHIERMVQPLNAPQERQWTIFYFINQYGFSLIDDLITAEASFNGKQHAIII